jgi:pyruvate dehydrogenase E2 component (dihydrolipoamide acetyltransferase)
MAEVIASPAVRALAARRGIDLDALAARLGRTTLAKEDVEGAGGAGSAPSGGDDPRAQWATDWGTDRATDRGTDWTTYWAVDHAQYGPVTEEPMPRMAQVGARNLAAANAMIPQVTHHDEADVSAIEAFRATLKREAAAKGVKLTALAFHVRALAACLRAHPRFNASLSADGRTLILKHYVHVGIAVDTPHGLVVPVIRDADQKGLWQIAGEIADLAARAQARKTRPDDLGGASMTITNLGGIGGTAFTPIVNPPELAILGITRTQVKPKWTGDTFHPVPTVPLDLSYDHRALNGADAARFLSQYANIIEKPQKMMV